MRRILVLSLLLALALLGPARPVLALNDWTVLLYWVGDDKESTALVKAHVAALNAIARRAGASGSYEFVVLFDAPPGYAAVDGKDSDGAFRFEPSAGKWSITRMGEVNMGSPYTLWNYLKWASEKHPARKYALFIGGHGSGIFSWRGPGEVDDPTPGRVDFDPGRAEPGRFVGYDDSDDDCLTLFEVKAVLAAFKEKLNAGRGLDLLVLDSCLPGAIETLYQLRELVALLVSSPSTTLIGGMPYVKVVETLAATPTLAPQAFAEAIAKAYVDKALSLGGRDEVMAVFSPARVQELAFALDQLSLAMIKAMAARGKRLSLQNLTTYGGKKRYWDLGRILVSLAEGTGDLGAPEHVAAIRALAGEAFEVFKSSRITTWYAGSFAESKVGGLSIAWPEKDEFKTWLPFYRALDFAAATHWDEFLAAWHGLSGQ